jgi:hypothetical protein
MSYTVDNVSDKPKTKDEYIKDLVASIAALEQAIQPFKDQKADIKKNYAENGWLSKDEIKYIMKAYNFAKKGDFDIDLFVEAYNKVK